MEDGKLGSKQRLGEREKTKRGCGWVTISYYDPGRDKECTRYMCTRHTDSGDRDMGVINCTPRTKSRRKT
jgi:hypothetical protein